MKIVFVSRLYLPHLGGVEVHLKEIAAILVRLGHEVTIVTWQHEKKLSMTAQYNGVQVFRIPFTATHSKQQTWAAITEYAQLFESADVVHVHDVFWWILPVYTKIKNKVFTTFHGWETKLPIPVNAKIHRFLANKLSRGTIHVGEFIQKFYWDKPNLLTYGGINLKRFTRSNSPQLKISKNKLQFVFVGRLDPDTDVSVYIEFLKELKTKNIDYSIVWVGDGSLREQCKLYGPVTGFVKNISQYITMADFVFASSYLSILEALCLGKLVLSFYSNPVKKKYLETFPGSQFLLIAGSVIAMQHKLEHLLTNRKLLSQMQLEAKAFAQKQTWERVVGKYLQLWKQRR